MFFELSKHMNNIVGILIFFLIRLSKQHNPSNDFLFFLVYSHIFAHSFILITIKVNIPYGDKFCFFKDKGWNMKFFLLKQRV